MLSTTLILSVIRLVCGLVMFLGAVRDAETGEVQETAESRSDINHHVVFLSLN